jgi:hypothetical protein
LGKILKNFLIKFSLAQCASAFECNLKFASSAL